MPKTKTIAHSRYSSWTFAHKKILVIFKINISSQYESYNRKYEAHDNATTTKYTDTQKTTTIMKLDASNVVKTIRQASVPKTEIVRLNVLYAP